MKDYAPGTWGLSFIFSLEGSVFPKAMACALPNGILAVALWYLFRRAVSQEIFDDTLSGVTVGQVWSAYNWVIGFLVSFRAQRAYSRWWEGGTLLQQARGEWFNAYSSLIAFCSRSEEKEKEVKKFQQTVSRLTSMLYASALMSIATESDLDFEIIDSSGLSEHHLEYLRTQPDKCEIIMQWIQRLIVDSMSNGVLPIAPPVLSRVFQELSRGIVNIHNVRKITEFQFPFPVAQMIVTMLVIQWFLTPVIAAVLVGTPVWAFIVAFFPVFACWGINYIAGEIEQPFGTDYNDMPMHFMQASMNTSILSLLDDLAQSPPDYDVEMGLQNVQSIIVEGRKLPGDNSNNISISSRSVRCVTIANPEQLNRVKHRFTQGRALTRPLGSEARRTKASLIQRLQGKNEHFTASNDWEDVQKVPSSRGSSIVPIGSERHDPKSSETSEVQRLTLDGGAWELAPDDRQFVHSAKSSTCTDTSVSKGVRFVSQASVQGSDSKPHKTSSTSHQHLSPNPPDANRTKRPPADTPGVILVDA